MSKSPWCLRGSEECICNSHDPRMGVVINNLCWPDCGPCQKAKAMADRQHFVTISLRVQDGVFGGSRVIPGILADLRKVPGVFTASAHEGFDDEEV